MPVPIPSWIRGNGHKAVALCNCENDQNANQAHAIVEPRATRRCSFLADFPIAGLPISPSHNGRAFEVVAGWNAKRPPFRGGP